MGLLWQPCFSLPEEKNTKPNCNGHIRQNNPYGSENVRKEIGGGREREMPVSDVLVERRGDPPAPVT